MILWFDRLVRITLDAGQLELDRRACVLSPLMWTVLCHVIVVVPVLVAIAIALQALAPV